VFERKRYTIFRSRIEIERAEENRRLWIALTKPGLPTNPDHLLQLTYEERSRGLAGSHMIDTTIALFKDYNKKAYSYIEKLVSQKRWEDASKIHKAIALNILELIAPHPEIDLTESILRRSRLKLYPLTWNIIMKAKGLNTEIRYHYKDRKVAILRYGYNGDASFFHGSGNAFIFICCLGLSLRVSSS
jgi:hypothetical protein